MQIYHSYEKLCTWCITKPEYLIGLHLAGVTWRHNKVSHITVAYINFDCIWTYQISKQNLTHRIEWRVSVISSANICAHSLIFRTVWQWNIVKVHNYMDISVMSRAFTLSFAVNRKRSWKSHIFNHSVVYFYRCTRSWVKWVLWYLPVKVAKVFCYFLFVFRMDHLGYLLFINVK